MCPQCIKQVSEAQDLSFQSTTLTKKPSPNTGTRSVHSSMEKQSSPMANANAMVFNSDLKKIRKKLPIIDSLLQPHSLMQSRQITWEYRPMPCTFFTYTYAPLPRLCTKTLITLLLPCFHMENVCNSSVTT